MRLLKPIPLAAAAAIALGAGASAYATGLVSTGGDSYTACVDNQNGNTRIVADGTACRAHERRLQLAGSTPAFERITINCAAGDNVTDAIAQTGFQHVPEVQVVIDGTCLQSVAIARDNVTLVAARPGDGIVAPNNGQPALTTIDPARLISVEGLTIEGGIYAGGADLGLGGVTIRGGQGVAVGQGRLYIGNSTIDGTRTGISADGGTVAGFNVAISNSSDTGVAVGGGATVTLKQATISASGFQGVVVSAGGAVVMYDWTISGSGDLGVDVTTGGAASIQASTISGNRGGVGVAGAALIQNTRVTGNRLFGVQGNGGRVDVRNSTIELNAAGPFPDSGYGVVGLLGSRISIGNTTIANNAGSGVELSGGSVATFDQLTSSGNGGSVDVHCAGPLSSIAGPGIAPATTNCASS